jgi:hypothetical protein
MLHFPYEFRCARRCAVTDDKDLEGLAGLVENASNGGDDGVLIVEGGNQDAGT